MPKNRVEGAPALDRSDKGGKRKTEVQRRGSVPWTLAKELQKHAPSDRADEAKTFPPAKEPSPSPPLPAIPPSQPDYLETGARARIRGRSHEGKKKSSPLPSLTMRVRSARLTRPTAAPALSNYLRKHPTLNRKTNPFPWKLLSSRAQRQACERNICPGANRGSWSGPFRFLTGCESHRGERPGLKRGVFLWVYGRGGIV